MFFSKEALINVASTGKTRRNLTKKRSLLNVNEHFEENSNAVLRVRSN